MAYKITMKLKGVDHHTGGKWSMHDLKRCKGNQSLSPGHSCWLSWVDSVVNLKLRRNMVTWKIRCLKILYVDRNMRGRWINCRNIPYVCKYILNLYATTHRFLLLVNHGTPCHRGARDGILDGQSSFFRWILWDIKKICVSWSSYISAPKLLYTSNGIF